MLEFLLTATGPDGKRDTLRIKADSAQEAYAELQSKGYVDITLHTDDVVAHLMDDMESIDNGFITAADAVSFRGMSNWRFFLFFVRKLYVIAWWLVLPAAGVLVWRIWATGSPGFFGYVAIFFLALPMLIALKTAYSGTYNEYEHMLEAFAWGQWEEVMERAKGLRDKIDNFELAAREACALAVLNRFEEGIAAMRMYAAESDIPDWMFQLRLAEVYDLIHEYDEALKCHRKAFEEAPDDPLVQLSLALSLLSNQKDTELAVSLIERAESQHLSDMAQTLLLIIKGLAATELNKYHEADEYFELLDAGLRPMAPASALVRMLLDINRACRAITLVRMGETARGENLFAQARPRLEAIRSTRLINRFKKALAEA